MFVKNFKTEVKRKVLSWHERHNWPTPTVYSLNIFYIWWA